MLSVWGYNFWRTALGTQELELLVRNSHQSTTGRDEPLLVVLGRPRQMIFVCWQFDAFLKRGRKKTNPNFDIDVLCN